MSEANKIQVGGTHYSKRGKLQHWDIVDRNNFGYFIGNITKYLFRWRDKNGAQDLRKACHYLAKYIEIATTRNAVWVDTPPAHCDKITDIVRWFELDYFQGSITDALMRWQVTRDHSYLLRAAAELEEYATFQEAESASAEMELAEQLRDYCWDASRPASASAAATPPQAGQPSDKPGPAA